MDDFPYVGILELGEIRFKEHLGIVTSEANTAQFSFYLSPPKNRVAVGKNDYVLIDHPVFGGTLSLDCGY